MLRGFWQALNCLSIHATYCVIIAGAFPGETKMWAAVRENDDFFAVGRRKTEPAGYFCRKLTLTRTPDPIRPTRGYYLGVFVRGVLVGHRRRQ